MECWEIRTAFFAFWQQMIRTALSHLQGRINISNNCTSSTNFGQISTSSFCRANITWKHCSYSRLVLHWNDPKATVYSKLYVSKEFAWPSYSQSSIVKSWYWSPIIKDAAPLLLAPAKFWSPLRQLGFSTTRALRIRKAIMMEAFWKECLEVVPDLRSVDHESKRGCEAHWLI